MIPLIGKGIGFRDRPLRPNEKYHHYCKECGAEVHPDFVHSHKCSPFAKIRGKQEILKVRYDGSR